MEKYMSPIAKQLFEDASRGVGFNKSALLKACLDSMTEDQVYKMAISERFIEIDPVIDYEKTTTEKIIDAVLSRHGE